MPHVPWHETLRLFGQKNRPYYKSNVRQRAILRKALELFSLDELNTTFGTTPQNLRVSMGNAGTSIGRISSSFVRNICSCLPLPSCKPTDAFLARYAMVPS